MKIITIFGARPHFIKAALLSKELRKKNQKIVIHTEHYDTEILDIFLSQMNIPLPNYNFESPMDFKNDSFYC